MLRSGKFGRRQSCRSQVAVVTNQTAFLVVRITFGTGNDTVDLFVNPAPGQPSSDGSRCDKDRPEHWYSW